MAAVVVPRLRTESSRSAGSVAYRATVIGAVRPFVYLFPMASFALALALVATFPDLWRSRRHPVVGLGAMFTALTIVEVAITPSSRGTQVAIELLGGLGVIVGAQTRRLSLSMLAVPILIATIAESLVMVDQTAGEPVARALGLRGIGGWYTYAFRVPMATFLHPYALAAFAVLAPVAPSRFRWLRRSPERSSSAARARALRWCRSPRSGSCWCRSSASGPDVGSSR
jgi:hypothetical protein